LAKIRFVPNANFNGTVSMTYHAWDQTSGSLVAEQRVGSLFAQRRL